MSYKEKIYEVEEKIAWLEYVLDNADKINDQKEEIRLALLLLEEKTKRDQLKDGVNIC